MTTSGTRSSTRPALHGLAALSLLILLIGGACDRSDVAPHAVAATTTTTGAPPDAATPDETANSADRLIFWVGHKSVTKLTDRDLDRLRGEGVDGFVVVMQRLPGLGSTQNYSPDADADLTGEDFSNQRALRDSNIARRAAAKGMKVYLAFYFSNVDNRRTPLLEWFDDDGWKRTALPSIGRFAAVAKMLGFAGLAVDQELYAQRGGTETATWKWTYPDNLRSEADTRQKAKERGKQVMRAMVEHFPELELTAYGTFFPDTWDEVVQEKANSIEDAYQASLQIDFWDGATGVRGYKAIRFSNALFYKTTNFRGATWDGALQYELNSFHSLLSRRLSDWSYASTRLVESPASWIDAGTTPFERARPPAYVADQLQAFHKWGMGGEFVNYAYRGLDQFDYKPYLAAMRAASTPAVVDSRPPSLVIEPLPEGTPAPPGPSLALRGTATDDMAIRAVRWENGPGSSGAAPMEWRVLSGDAVKGWEWRMDWSIDSIPLARGTNKIVVTAEDVKGLTTSTTLTVVR